jgi:hypothetical protein
MSHTAQQEDHVVRHLEQSGGAHHHLSSEQAFDAYLRGVLGGLGAITVRSLYMAVRRRFRLP